MQKNKKDREEKNSIGGLLAKIDKIDRKLNLFSTLGKTMPAIVLSSGAILGALVYLISIATVPDTTTELPATGGEIEVTNDFVILYPENYSSTSLPDEVKGLSLNGFYDDLTRVTFLAQKYGGDEIEIGEGTKGSEAGEYTTTWASADAGKYYVWAKITKESGLEYKSASVIVNIY
jgi:hypothetical protein